MVEWVPENSKYYDRKGLRYPSDMADAEGALIEPLNSSGQARWPEARGQPP
jgi:hypothetical protein